MKLYIDLIFLLNFIFDFLLLLGVSILLKRQSKIIRILLGGVVGGLSILLLFLNINTVELFFVKIIIALIMVIVTFGFKDIRFTIKNLSFLYLLSIILRGFLYLLNISLSKYFKDNKKISMIGFLDTGNKLKDPYKSRPIILVNSDCIKDYIKGYKKILVPYYSLNNNSILECVKANKIEINKRLVCKNFLLGLSKDKINIDGVSVYLVQSYWRIVMIKKIINLVKKILSKLNLIFYVGSTDILPEPLSKEEELYHLEQFQLGNMNSKDKLIEHNLRLVVFLAKKYENTNIDLEDLVSIGSIGLIKGINTYKINKNIKLATYASRCIDNEILVFLRKNKKRRSEISLEDSLSYDAEGNELHLEDVLGPEPDIVTKEIEKETEKTLMIKEIDKLDKRDKEIIMLRYGLFNHEEMTQKDVAKLLGISQSYISRIEKKVIKRLNAIAKM